MESNVVMFDARIAGMVHRHLDLDASGRNTSLLCSKQGTALHSRKSRATAAGQFRLQRAKCSVRFSESRVSVRSGIRSQTGL